MVITNRKDVVDRQTNPQSNN